MYLDRNKILSYNASLNFIVLKRGYGKTFTFKDYVISEFKKKGKKTVWIRRYKPELKKCLSKFLNDIINRYPDDKIEIKNKSCLLNGVEFISFYTLSEAQDLKSLSFNDYDYLIFDEFIIEGGTKHYIPQECDVFCSLLSTVFRDRPMKAFLLGNKVKTVTPYNIYFQLPPFNTIKYINDTKTLLYCTDGDGIVENNYSKSDLVKVLKNTPYYDYSVVNNTLDESTAFIESRPKDLKTNFIIKIENKDVGLFFDTEHSKIYFDLKCDSTVKNKYSLSKNNLSESYMLLSKKFPLAKMLQDAYINGRVFYTDIKVKSLANILFDYLV